MKENQDQENHEVIQSPRSESVLSTLKSQNLLTKNDWSHLEEAKEFITECFTTVPMYRPLPVKLFGVLNDAECPTPESKLWQCKVEAEVHADQLIEDIHNLELLRINLDRAEYSHVQMIKNLESESDPNKKAEIEFDLREHKVHMSRLEYKAVKLQKQIKYRIDEVHEWKKISAAIENSHEGLETKSYVKQYVNNMRFNLTKKIEKTEDDKEKAQLEAQVGSFDKIINQMESL
jgi:hypothetical protein